MIARPVVVSAVGRTARKGFTLVEVLAVVTIIMILAGLSTFAVVRTLDNAKINETYIKMSKVESAARTYYTESGQNWPSSAMDLVQPTAGGAPLLEGGLAAITDPWGQQFQLSVTQDQAGSERVVVMTTNPKTGQQLIWPKQ